MPDGGTLRIDASSITFDRAQAAAHHLPNKGEYVELVVADTGIGMDERTLATPEFVLFVNDPQLLGETYVRYLEAQIRAAQPFPGLPLMLNFRPRSETTRQVEHR
jgi:predicted GTPase